MNEQLIQQELARRGLKDPRGGSQNPIASVNGVAQSKGFSFKDLLTNTAMDVLGSYKNTINSADTSGIAGLVGRGAAEGLSVPYNALDNVSREVIGDESQEELKQFIGGSKPVQLLGRAQTGAVDIARDLGGEKAADLTDIAMQTLPDLIGLGAASKGAKLAGKAARGAADMAGDAAGAVGRATSGIGGKAANVATKGIEMLEQNMLDFSKPTIDTIKTLPTDVDYLDWAKSMDMDSLTSDIEGALIKRDDELAGIGKEYEQFHNSTDTIDVSPIDMAKMIEDSTGIPIKVVKTQSPSGLDSVFKTVTGQDIPKTEKFTYSVDPKQTLLSRPEAAQLTNLLKGVSSGKVTTGEFITLRRNLGQMRNWDSARMSSVFDRSVGDLYKKFNDTYRDKIAGLKEVDTKYASEANELKEVLRGLGRKVNSGEIRMNDSVASFFRRALKPGNAQILQRLEKIDPSIRAKIENVLAAEEILKKENSGYMSLKSAFRTGGGGLLGGPLGALVGAVSSTPQAQRLLLKGTTKLKDIINRTKKASSKPDDVKAKSNTPDSDTQKGNSDSKTKAVAAAAIIGGSAGGGKKASADVVDKSGKIQEETNEDIPSKRALEWLKTLNHEKKVTLPKITEIGKEKKDGTVTIKTDDGNTFEVRELPTEWKQAITKAYESNPKIPRGLLEATLMKESAMGTITSGDNNKNDVAHIDPTAWKALGYKEDAKTVAESIKRMAEVYTKLAIPFSYDNKDKKEGDEGYKKDTEYKNELRLYKERYNKSDKYTFNPAEFSAYISYYK